MKKKTPVVKKSLNPNYDHTFVYSGLSLEQLRGMCLELTVWDREALLSNEFLGGVRLSCGKGEIILWPSSVFIHCLRDTVVYAHVLYSPWRNPQRGLVKVICPLLGY